MNTKHIQLLTLALGLTSCGAAWGMEKKEKTIVLRIKSWETGKTDDVLMQSVQTISEQQQKYNNATEKLRNLVPTSIDFFNKTTRNATRIQLIPDAQIEVLDKDTKKKPAAGLKSLCRKTTRLNNWFIWLFNATILSPLSLLVLIKWRSSTLFSGIAAGIATLGIATGAVFWKLKKQQAERNKELENINKTVNDYAGNLQAVALNKTGDGSVQGAGRTHEQSLRLYLATLNELSGSSKKYLQKVYPLAPDGSQVRNLAKESLNPENYKSLSENSCHLKKS